MSGKSFRQYCITLIFRNPRIPAWASELIRHTGKLPALAEVPDVERLSRPEAKTARAFSGRYDGSGIRSVAAYRLAGRQLHGYSRHLTNAE